MEHRQATASLRTKLELWHCQDRLTFPSRGALVVSAEQAATLRVPEGLPRNATLVLAFVDSERKRFATVGWKRARQKEAKATAKAVEE